MDPGHWGEGWSGRSLPLGLGPNSVPSRVYTPSPKPDLVKGPPSSCCPGLGSHLAGCGPGRGGPFPDETLSPASTWLVYLPSSPSPPQGFATHYGPFPPLRAPSAGCRDPCVSVGGIAVLREPHRNGGVGRLTSYIVPFPAQRQHLPWGPRFLCPELAGFPASCFSSLCPSVPPACGLCQSSLDAQA